MKQQEVKMLNKNLGEKGERWMKKMMTPTEDEVTLDTVRS